MFYYVFVVIKFGLAWIDFILWTLVLYALSFLPKSWSGTWYSQLFRVWCRVFVRALGVDLRLLQQNKFPLPKQFILIANHPSAFEDIGVPALFSVYSLAKIQVKNWFIVGRISEAAGTLYVERESKDSRSAATQEILQTLESGKSIALYPEGGCKGRRIFESFRYGAFDISLTSGIPIVPLFLHYEAQETFEWVNPQTLIHKIWHFLSSQNNRANYYVFDAIDPKQFSDKESYNAYVHHLYLQWQKKYLE